MLCTDEAFDAKYVLNSTTKKEADARREAEALEQEEIEHETPCYICNIVVSPDANRYVLEIAVATSNEMTWIKYYIDKLSSKRVLLRTVIQTSYPQICLFNSVKLGRKRTDKVLKL